MLKTAKCLPKQLQSSGLQCEGGDVGVQLIDSRQAAGTGKGTEVKEPEGRGRGEKHVDVSVAFMKKINLSFCTVTQH